MIISVSLLLTFSTVQISSAKVDFMDLKEISSEASPQLFMDILAGERSILRKVFGILFILCLLEKLLVDKPKLLYAFFFLLILFYNNLSYGKYTKMESGGWGVRVMSI